MKNSSPLPPTARQALVQTGQAPAPIFTAHDGEVFHRGIHRSADECERLLTIFRADPWLPDLAVELADAMRAAADQQQPDETAQAA